ncbi:hypothetical protein [Pontiella desulfatans]|uniref:hypothetical protein n=1 Tax=Pontiella desulfatans TaxID=2750659 RepID=UPI0014444DA7|nr:hypothetical protein [Pontiella desulfatans]
MNVERSHVQSSFQPVAYTESRLERLSLKTKGESASIYEKNVRLILRSRHPAL